MVGHESEPEAEAEAKAEPEAEAEAEAEAEPGKLHGQGCVDALWILDTCDLSPISCRHLSFIVTYFAFITKFSYSTIYFLDASLLTRARTLAFLCLPEPISGASPFVPRGDFHAMDCTDIVIGSARGNLYRIGDFYTRDRSTPRSDEFWGGDDSLTAALGWEEDGQTTIVFRRKLNGEERSSGLGAEGVGRGRLDLLGRRFILEVGRCGTGSRGVDE